MCAPHQENFVHESITIDYSMTGEGEAVLFLHGFAASSHTWRHVADLIDGSRKVISLDLMGFGESDKPPKADYSAYAQADIVAAFLDRQGLSRVTVVGNSFGGRVAMDLLSLPGARGRIRALVLIDSAVPGAVLPLKVRLVKRLPVVAALSALIPARAKVRLLLDAAFYDTTLIEPDAVEQYAIPLRSDAGLRAFIRTAGRIFAHDDRETIWRDLDKVRCPVLLIWGENDTAIPLVNGERLCSAIPDSRLLVIPQCGHMPQEEKPREVADAILRFLREVNHPGPSAVTPDLDGRRL